MNPEEYTGKFPIRQDITVLPPDDPKKMKLGWTIHERTATSNNIYDHSNKAFETDEADAFLSDWGVTPGKRKHGIFADLEILADLKGKPWNNLALSAVLAFKPSMIRVTTGCVTCDEVPDRVTVFVNDDKRTIRRITQELSPEGIGCKTGQDFSTKMEGRPLPPPSDEPIVYINDYAVAKVKIDK